MALRIQCNVCGAKSIAVETLPSSAKEQEVLADFQTLHNITCAPDRTIYPDGATSVELPHEVIAACQVGPFGSKKPPLRSVAKAHGHVEMTGPYGEQQTGDTLSCCHCSAHWIVRAGSGRIRGWCSRCCGYTCGRAACNECIPVALRIDNTLSGLPVMTPAQLTVTAWKPGEKIHDSGIDETPAGCDRPT